MIPAKTETTVGSDVDAEPALANAKHPIAENNGAAAQAANLLRERTGADPQNETHGVSIVPNFSDRSRSKTKELTEEEEEAKRIRQMKRQMYEQALNAPTTVKIDENIGRNGKSPDQLQGADQLAAVLKAAGATADPSAAINDRLGDLAALANSAGGASGSDANNQKGKKQFSEEQNTGKFGYLMHTRVAPISPYEIKSGTIIPGVLITAINSDLPGMIVGQVSQNVYDTATGKYLIIPQGTKIVGSYDSQVSYGQQRALVVWNKLTFPDASDLFIGTMSGADQAGAAGLHDQVNNHYVKLFGSALMLSIFSAGVQYSQPPASGVNVQPTAQQTLAAEFGREMGQLGEEVIRKQMNVQPTIEIRPGYRFSIMVNKDLVLMPYTPMAPRSVAAQ